MVRGQSWGGFRDGERKVVWDDLGGWVEVVSYIEPERGDAEVAARRKYEERSEKDEKEKEAFHGGISF